MAAPTRKPYLTDLTDDQWAILQPLVPPAKPGGCSQVVGMESTSKWRWRVKHLLKLAVLVWLISGGAVLGCSGESSTAMADAQPNCRNNLGGEYVFPHTGIKPDGNFFSALVYFVVKPLDAAGGTFDVHGTINARGRPPFEVDATGRPYQWVETCLASWDRSGFVGHISQDGSMIAFVTLDEDEQMAGTTFRIRRLK